MKRHINKPDPPKGASSTRPSKPASPHNLPKGRGGSPHRPEPEPIIVPPRWQPKPRRRHWRIIAKASFVLGAFALMSLPFVLNHLEHGVFYYQQIEEPLPPEDLPPEMPPDLPYAEFAPPIGPAEQPPAKQDAPEPLAQPPASLITDPS